MRRREIDPTDHALLAAVIGAFVAWLGFYLLVPPDAWAVLFERIGGR